MIQIETVSQQPLVIETVVINMDTLLVDGALPATIVERLNILQDYVEIHLIAAQPVVSPLAWPVHHMPQGSAQRGAFILSLRADTVAVVGHSASDSAMFNAAALRIGVIGPGGIASALISQCDILITGAESALDLLLYPTRIAATLRR